MPPLKGFCGPTGMARSTNVAADRLLNMYLEESSNEKGVYTLYSMPGLRQVAELPSGPVRGLYEATNGRVFATTSTTLFEVFAGYTFLSRGTIHTGTTPASFTDDGVHMVFTVDGIGYGYAFATDALTTLPITGPQTFGQVAYLDGRILVNEPGTRHFWFSGHFDALTWDPLAFYEAEGRADDVATLITDHREAVIGGTQSVEFWQSTGRPFPDPQGIGPYARMNNVFLEQGIETPYTLAALDNRVYFLGGSPRGEGPVWVLNGYTPERISTHALESAMAGMPTVGDAIACTARHGGHAWYVLDFPSGAQTWAFDTATQAWAEWPRLLEDGSFGNYPSNTHCSAFAEHLWGDRSTGALYVWDINYHRYGTGARLCRRTSPHVRNEQKRIRYSQFRVECEAGVGLDGAPPVGANPQMMLRTSMDGGHSWSSGRWRSMGRIGATRQQAAWYALGQAREMAFEVSISDPVKVALLAAYLEVG
jgi:hypothetical protein